MNTLAVCAQVIIAISIVIVWVFRFDNIVKEFKQYGIPDLLRNIVGASKIVLSTLLVVGIWYHELVVIPALMMSFLMVCAQIVHVRTKNPIVKFVPSFVLLILSLFVAAYYSGVLKS